MRTGFSFDAPTEAKKRRERVWLSVRTSHAAAKEMLTNSALSPFSSRSANTRKAKAYALAMTTSELSP